MIKVGCDNRLTILRETGIGLYLGDDEGEDVLLPNKYCPRYFDIDDKLTVFVYRDSEGRKIATSITPKVKLQEFAFLEVTANAPMGNFMDWGLEKELLIPFKEQRVDMEVGKSYVVYLDIDKETDRLFASSKIDKYLSNENLELTDGDKVEVVVYRRTELGFSVIVNNAHKGLIYKNEIFKSVSIGDKLNAFVKSVREDNLLDISLQAQGFNRSNEKNTQIILKQLKQNDGFIALTDRSNPNDIYLQFGMSKKAFKKAIGSLYKRKVISIQSDGIKLL